ncbi:MAG TPA: DNA-directed RNA polymerase subunit beta, partial [bacterium]|nr:DNA-directed RNA polymerase subunit beta [bacterium]
MKIKNFGTSKVNFSLPYLLKIQQDTWNTFWDRDLKELFSEVSPIKDYSGKEWELWFLDYKLGEKKYSSELEAKDNNDSYEATLKVKCRLKNLKTKEIKEQEVFLADFPIITERGTFIINGVERVAISQLIRSPGVFFTSRVLKGKNLFGAKIIPNRGAWLEFETDSSGFIGIKIDRKRKVASTTLMRAFGIDSDEKIKETFKDIDIGEIKYIDETIKKDPTKDRSEALVEIYRHLRPGDLATSDTAKELIENMFFNFKRYDLSKVGRWKTRQRFSKSKSKNQNLDDNKDITIEDRVLKQEDIVNTLKEIIRLNNDPEAKPDQIDHLGNRRVRTLNELLQNRLRVGLMRMERIIKDRISTLDAEMMTPNQIINPRPLMAVISEFFASSQMSQFMDQENLLAELEHKRRLTATGPGGLTRERAGFEVRDVQPSHYGRICPIQTPEGANVGLVGYLAGFSRINSYGFIETPYLKVENSKVTSKVQYFSAFEEEKYNICHAGVPIDDNGKIIPKKVPARTKGVPGVVEKEKIDFIDVSPEQFLSIGTGLIPFLRNDDANRAQMGSNMQRQAVPLIKPQRPFVSTGLEERVAIDSGQEILSKEDGVVISVDANHVKVKTSSKIQRSREKTYYLKSFVRTNQYTCFHQRPTVKKGDVVKKGTVLAEGGAIDDGNLALGRNLLVAFLSWRGENYEDAIIISDKLVKEDLFTSIHIENFKCDVRETKLGPELTTPDIPNVSEDKLKDLDEEGIVRIGAEVRPRDILVGKISPKGEADLTAEERLLRAIFGEKAREVKDASLTMDHGKRGRVTGVRIFSRELGHKLEPGVIKRIMIEVSELRKVTAGDKLAGRHGNKGVISRVLPE